MTKLEKKLVKLINKTVNRMIDISQRDRLNKHNFNKVADCLCVEMDKLGLLK